MTMRLVGWAIVHSLWQGGLIALFTAGVFALTRRARALVRYSVGLLGLALMLALPIATATGAFSGSSDNALVASSAITSPTILVPVGNPVSTNSLNDRVTTPTSAQPPSRTNPVVAPGFPPSGLRATADRFVVSYLESALPWLALAWMLGLLVASARLVGGLVRTRRITRNGSVSPSVALVQRVRELSVRLGVSRGIRVLQSVSIDVPLVVGALRPVIVVPASLLTGLTPLQLDMILAHELAHIRRYDFLVNLVQTVIEMLLFYHPAARWLSARVREERENCCDDIAVVACGGDANRYTATLLALEESRGRDFGLAAAATGGSLLRRAHRLITGKSPNVELGPHWIAGVITIAAVLFTGREAMGGIAASFEPASTSYSAEKSDSTGKHNRDPDPTRAAPASVMKSPAGGSLADRWRWADKQARGNSSYWVGYLVAGDPKAKARYYADDIPVRIDRTTTMSGHMQFGDADLSGMTFYGVPLAPVVGTHERTSTVIFVLFSNATFGKRIERVHVGTFEIPMYFDRRPVMWLDSANDAESIEMIQSLMPKARGEDMQRDLVAAIGVHQTDALVEPRLIEILRSGSEEGMRREAVEWLGKKNDGRAIAVLSQVIRTDRSKGVREEAIEAFTHMQLPSATDSLIAFASTLPDEDNKRDAIEALGHRDDARAHDYLVRVVRTSRGGQLGIEAIEAIASMPGGRGSQTIVDFARNDPDAGVRREAVESLVQSEPGERALDLLLQIARTDPDDAVRREAIETIAQVHDPKSVGILRDLANNSTNSTIQIEAVESLGETDDPAATPVLRDIARRHPRSEVRKRALETLGNSHDDQQAIDALVEAARSEIDGDVVTSALESLGDSKSAAALAALASLARPNEPLELRRRAMEAYGENTRPTVALNFLRDVIARDPDPSIRMRALGLLGELDDDAGLATLRDIARNSRDPNLRSRATDILSER